MTRPASLTAQLVAFTTASFLGFLAIGIPLPALAVFVHDSLGFSAFAVGVVIGTQSLATLLTRQYAGRLSDTRSPKRATLAAATGGSPRPSQSATRTSRQTSPAARARPARDNGTDAILRRSFTSVDGDTPGPVTITPGGRGGR